ncbi:MAG: TIGR04283 family arsenosugar biosynthesis glycosyltransferase [Bacteroidetes bacterium]|nr:TIGR04283 family arsenosugar biosynthesis glycosyltransferase [Bacteroidota bacterium]MDA1343894.1 TIGR04283 family arsenosugar biosynthesis glycosyltransferase [Bacteroidota bacterium]
MTKKGVSIILPVWNEVDAIPALLDQLATIHAFDYEVLFVDGGSNDGSKTLLKRHSEVLFIESQKGRAHQLNAGARIAKFEWLYFLHVDSTLPTDLDLQLRTAMNDPQQAACFSMQFDHKHPLLRLSAYFTKFNFLSCRGGDQSLLIHRHFFENLGGFDPKFSVCEDLDLIKKIYKHGRFKVLPGPLITAARRFEKNGVLYLLLHFGIIHFLHAMGTHPNRLKRYYDYFVV